MKTILSTSMTEQLIVPESIFIPFLFTQPFSWVTDIRMRMTSSFFLSRSVDLLVRFRSLLRIMTPFRLSCWTDGLLDTLQGLLGDQGL